jgi:hypothetical protein
MTPSCAGGLRETRLQCPVGPTRSSANSPPCGPHIRCCKLPNGCIARARLYAARQGGCALMDRRRTVLPMMLMRATWPSDGHSKQQTVTVADALTKRIHHPTKRRVLTFLQLSPAIEAAHAIRTNETNSQQTCLAISRDFNVQIARRSCAPRLACSIRSLPEISGPFAEAVAILPNAS